MLNCLYDFVCPHVLHIDTPVPTHSPDDHKLSPLWVGLYLVYYILLIFSYALAGGYYSNILFYPMVFLCPLAFYYMYKRFVRRDLVDPRRTQKADLFRAFSHAFWGGGAFAGICEFVLSLILVAIFYQRAKSIFDDDTDIGKLRKRPEVHIFVFLTAYLVAGFVEEATKGMILQHCTKLYLAHPLHLHRADIETFVWLGLTVGLGFGTMEGVLYVCVYTGNKGILIQFITWLIRVLLAIPFHTVLGFMWGMQLSRREVAKQELTWIQMGWKQVLWHGTYDFFEMEFLIWERKPFLLVLFLECLIAVVILASATYFAHREYKKYHSEQELLMIRDEEEEPYPNN